MTVFRKSVRHANQPLRIIVTAIGLLAAAYLLGITWLLHQKMNAGYALLAGTVDLACVAWTFWVGSAIGSFLNVVAWRLPRGKSVGGRSHCPYCCVPILARDNIPVFGWLALRGRCRACRLPISVRYPLVELAVGISLMLVGLAVLYRGREYLPLSASTYGNNWPLRLAELSWQEYLAMGYLFASLAGLWAFGLVRMDGFRLPAKLVVPSLLVVAAFPLLFPFLQPLPWQSQVPLVPEPSGLISVHHDDRLSWRGTSSLEVLMYLICAAGAGIFLARLVRPFLFPAADLKLSPLGKDSGSLVDASIAWTVAGMLIGWQSLCGIFPIILLTAMALRRRLPSYDPTGMLLLATPIGVTIVMVLWPWLLHLPFWPAPGNSRYLYLIYPTVAWLFAWLFWPRVA